MFDAVTMTLGMHLWQKLGRGVIEWWFPPYIRIELGLAEPTARRVLENLFELYTKEDPPDTAMTDGGFDGVAILQGRNAHRLTDHFGFDSEAPVSPEQMQAFRTFHDRDRVSASPE
jgi:hypothetical protein